MIIPDATKRTVRLAVRIEGEKVVQFDRSPLPKVRNGAMGDLILLASDIVGESDRKNLQSESLVPLLPEGSVVLVALSPETMKGIDDPRLRTASELKIGAGYCFAEVRLQEVLVLRLRGYKDPCLEPCECLIPSLNMAARSLNHAFTLLSTAFEVKRISHSGNVFERVFYRAGAGFRPLSEARARIDLGASRRRRSQANAKTVLAEVITTLRGIAPTLSGDDSVLADAWEEIKDELQGELSFIWPAYLDTIEGVIESTLTKLAPEDLLMLSTELKNKNQDRKSIRDALLPRLLDRARKERIQYKPFEYQFFWYSQGGLTIYNRILKRTGMHACLIRAHSGGVPSGEQGEVDLALIDRRTDINIMTAEEFEEARRLRWPHEPPKLPTEERPDEQQQDG